MQGATFKKAVIALILLPVVLAFNAGSTFHKEFSSCAYLEVNISAEHIEDNEFIVYDTCSETVKNYYVCDCEFTIDIAQNAVNNYSIEFDVYSDRNTGGGGSSGSRHTVLVDCGDFVCGEWGNCINSFRKRDCVNDCTAKTELEKCGIIKPAPLPEQEQDFVPVDEIILSEPLPANETVQQEQQSTEIWLVFIILGSVLFALILGSVILIFYNR